TIPTNKSQVFSTAADSQTSVEVHVLQGEREMAAYNKTLGRFSLNNIPPAPRGVPQIEVTFDIDANGIVHVTAKDLGTGNSQDVTITSSTNLSDEDIEKAVKEAEQFAAEDKKNKEKVEVKNTADNMVYQTEKTLTELGDKISEEEKGGIQAEVDKLKELIKTDDFDVEAVKAQTDAVSQKFYAVSQKLYEQAAQAQQAQGGADAGATDDNVVDAEYTVVDDENK
ncbi:MAG: Hsp70 family protein, partial [Clostridia bacterium]|nr:Hsp70 family protein [Clostridia bacterium]